MSGSSALMHRVAVHLLRHAAKVLPPNREHWAAAMSAELAHIPDDGAIFKWALGCVVASYSERIHAMTKTRPVISRWVLCVEMLGFFGFSTVGFFSEITPPYYAPWQQTLFVLSMALLGPVGLIAAFRSVVLNRPALPASAVWILGILAAWVTVAFMMFMWYRDGTMDLDWWRGYLLFGPLPALAAAHLIYLANRSRRVDAALA
jgi:hypothetical protein